MNIKTQFRENGIEVQFDDTLVVTDYIQVQAIIETLSKLRKDHEVKS